MSAFLHYSGEKENEKETEDCKPGIKATVALTAIRGEMTMTEMVKRFDVQAAQITQWKKQLLSSAEAAFDS